jgi:hypothetical protein
LTVNGDVTISPAATFVANNSNLLTIGGNWSNNGTFTAGTSTVAFNSSSAQTVDNNQQNFSAVVSSNTSSSGLTFSNGFSATALTVNASALGSSATVYFAGNSTFIISTFNVIGSATQLAVLRSTTTGTSWFLNNTSSQTVRFADVKDSNASGGLLIQTDNTSIDRGNNINWDFGAPSAISVISASQSTFGATIDLSWTSPGDDGANGTLINSTFTIQYTTDTTFAQSNSWSPTGALPTVVYRIDIPTTNVSVASQQRTSFSNLISGGTYYFRIWTKDDVGNYSPLSNGATNWATVVISRVHLSTDTLNFGALLPGATVVYSSSITVTNTGNTTASFQLSITDPAVWRSTDNPAGLDSFRLTGVFKNTKPNPSDFDIANDFINTSTHTATSTIFARDTDGDSEKGINVSVNDQRALWFRIEMPPISTTDTEQVIRINASSQ